MAGVGKYNVVGDEASCFLIDQDDNIAGTLIAQGGGWWRGRAPDGRVRNLFVAPGEDGDPRLIAAQRLIGQ